jgi:periplasmic copper chaperone A
MTTVVRDIFVFVTAAIFVAASLLIATAAGAHDFKVGALDIGHPWSRPTPADASIAGGYLTITNKGKTADRLISGASPAAGQIEMHEVVDVDGMAKTRPLANGI